eukprot:Phypoly_transcript_05190.p1 GENE.Phypoly_transcript_05190~~Phypoly_transcript_05190.p1  ORF type:complete len:592 (+),score=139.22 Phypoly_transcript_05190:164-1939(+)
MGLSDLFIDPTLFLPEPKGYGFLHLLFLLIAYGFILSKASALISDGSELLLLIPALAGIVGSVVLPVLGAVPDGAIVLFSGMGTADEVKEQIAVGVGALAGSTIMLLTIPWALCIFQGRVDIDNGEANYTKKPKLSEANKWSWKNCGITPRHSININGKIMLGTAISYVIIQLAAFGSGCAKNAECHPAKEHWAALVALLSSILFFIGYLVYNVKFADEQDKEDKVVEVKKKAIESHILSISAAFELSLESDGDGKRQTLRFDDALHKFFKKYDRNGDNVIDAYEMRALLSDLNEDMSEERFQEFLKGMDEDGSGTISFKEFAAAMKGWVEQKNRFKHQLSFPAEVADRESSALLLNENRHEAGGSSALSALGSSEGITVEVRSHDDAEKNAEKEAKKQKKVAEAKEEEEEEDEDEEEVPEDLAHLPPKKRTMRILLRSGWMMGLGTVVVLLFSDPMVDVLNAMGKELNIAPFYVAFVLAPLASNASELIASIAYAKKKSKKTITISLGALLGAAAMNNTFCLFIFLCLVFAKNLAWEFSAEVISIIFIEVCLFVFALLKTTKLWHAAIIISLYPFSIFLVWLLENVAGLN